MRAGSLCSLVDDGALQHLVHHVLFIHIVVLRADQTGGLQTVHGDYASREAGRPEMDPTQPAELAMSPGQCHLPPTPAAPRASAASPLSWELEVPLHTKGAGMFHSGSRSNRQTRSGALGASAHAPIHSH